MWLCVLWLKKCHTHLRGPHHLLMYGLHQCVNHAWLFEDGIHSLHISTHEGIVDGWVSAPYLGRGSTDRLDPLVSVSESGGGGQWTPRHSPSVCQCPPGILPVLKLLLQPKGAQRGRTEGKGVPGHPKKRWKAVSATEKKEEDYYDFSSQNSDSFFQNFEIKVIILSCKDRIVI